MQPHPFWSAPLSRPVLRTLLLAFRSYSRPPLMTSRHSLQRFVSSLRIHQERWGEARAPF
eukprot:6187770-Pleurochrysis_carterae.AAC.3